METRVPRTLAGVSAIVLVATAAFHASGYRAIVSGVSASALSPFFRSALPGIWLFFSWHLVALALGVAWASIRGSSVARPLVWFIAVVACVDTLFVFSLAGVFAGTVLLALAAIGLVTAAVRWPSA